MKKEFFPDIPKIKYEGPDSKNPLSFKYYNPNEKVGKKSMKDHLRFAMAYWHTMNGGGSDPFGVETMLRPWSGVTNLMELSRIKMEALFELCGKLGMNYFCFHDRDIAPEGETLRETNRNLDEIVWLTKGLIEETGIELLWGTACLFSHPRFVHGAATSCNPDVFAYSAAQVKKALEVTMELGGNNYVFWGGREGYETLLNTNMQLELDNLGRFMNMAVDYAKEIGFTGQFLFEPKPKEPAKHQYDFDSAAVLGFLYTYGLRDTVKLNIETNHATLAGHEMQHELHFARISNLLGSVDANQGDLLLGWDTDQFPSNLYVSIFSMYEILKNGGLGSGGLNFDAKVRRASFEPEDLVYGHITGMDSFARGLKIAYRMLEDKELDRFVEQRYAGYSEGIGKKIVEGSVGFRELEEYAMEHDRIVNTSGRQELLENMVNSYI